MKILEHPWPSPTFSSSSHWDLPPLALTSTYGPVTFSSEGTHHPFRMYVCGITPYDATHLGHAATYIFFDLINRYMRARGNVVKFVENITDIDEPLLERAQRDSVAWEDLAQGQTDLFVSDMVALRNFSPDYFVPVTQVMSLVEMVIDKIIANGYTYRLGDDIYFRVATFLDRLPIAVDDAILDFANRGGDPGREGKEHPLDPVLWIANKPGEPGWESKHGFGRPGWHVECTAISLRYLLGENFSDAQSEFLIELQGGGSDLIFPHHFMSAAQVKAFTGSNFAQAYVHTGMIGLNGEKMSKSKGNLVFVSSLLQQGVDPMVIRFALLSQPYSSNRDWNAELLKSSSEKVARIRSALSRSEVAPTRPIIASIGKALSNNLDTPRVIEILLEWASSTEAGQSGGSAGELSRFLDEVLGLAL